MENEYELTIHDYLDILKRRALLMSVVFIIVFSIAILFSIVRPPVYQSSGTILIESQQISSNIISTTVSGYAFERIEIIKQRVMTRENLLRIIDKFSLFKSNDNKYVVSELVDKMRKGINLELLSTERGRRGRGNIAFTLSFENRYPELAYKVTNELVTLFLNENIKQRVERATETTEFLSQEAKRLKADLEKIESLVADYKQENANALPEHLDLKMQMLERTQRTLSDLDRDFKAKQVELSRLELDLESEKSGSNGGSSLSEIEELKAEYKKAKLLYKENHPTVRLLKHKIDAINKTTGTVGGQHQDNNGVYNMVLVSRLESMINTIRSEMTSIEEQKKPLLLRVKQLEDQIIKTPQVELGLSTLLRDHGNAKAKYEEIQAKQLSAKVAENLEGENKSERFTLIDPPLFPDKPIRPNRKKIILLGILLAFAMSGGIAFLVETLNKKIRGAGALTLLTGELPLVEIPYITTVDEHLKKKNMIVNITITTFGLILLLLLIVHFAYMQIDILFYKILTRLG